MFGTPVICMMFAKNIADWLSQYILVLLCNNMRSYNSSQSQISDFTASLAAKNDASIVERATIYYWDDFHTIGLPTSV